MPSSRAQCTGGRCHSVGGFDFSATQAQPAKYHDNMNEEQRQVFTNFTV